MKKLSDNKLAGSLLTLICVCITVSIIGFKIEWGKWPELVDVLMGSTIFAPLAIPKAFGDVLRITNPYSSEGVVPMMIAYWPAVIGLVWYLFRSRLLSIFVILALISLIASVKWQVAATGMMGI